MRKHKRYDDKTLILVTHVPKCVGTSLRDCIVEGLGIAEEAIYFPRGGIKKIRKEHPDHFNYMVGHFPWGIHHFFRIRSQVFWSKKIHIATFRDPLDQMISYYYYQRMLGENSPYFGSGGLECSMVEFFKKYPLACNMQLRMYSGKGLDRTNLSAALAKYIVLKIAVHNVVHNYHYYVHHQYLSESIRILGKGMGFKLELKRNPITISKDRPSIEEVSGDCQSQLRKLNKLDYMLHAKLSTVFKEYFLGD